MSQEPELSVVLPTLDESAGLKVLLPRLSALFQKLGVRGEILVVDGGSKDDTAAVAAAHGARVLRQKGPGFGSAVREGIAAARAEYVALMDADGSHAPEALERFWARRKDAELIVGSRYCPGGSAVMPLTRQILSRSLNMVSRLVLDLPVRESSSGFRLYFGPAARAVKSGATDFSVQQDLLVGILAAGGRVIELPIHYAPRVGGASKANAWKLAPAYIRLLLRLNKLRGGWRAGAGLFAALVLALGLGLRFAYAWHGHRAHYLPTSNDGYETIALSLVSRGEFALMPGLPTSRREPSYPLFIAAVYALFGARPGLVIFLQCLLSAATGWLLWLTGRRLFGAGVALAALAAFMLHPQSIYYCAYFFRETWLCFWFGLLLWASLGWSAAPGDPEGERGALIGGLASAAFGLANSAVLPACGLAGILLWLAAPPKARARRAALYFAPLLLAFGAWTARNWNVSGRFVAGSTHGGEEFYTALVVPPDDLGTPRQTEILASDPYFFRAQSLPEAECNAVLMKASLRWIAAHPALYASRAAAGLVKFWKVWPYNRTYQHSYALLVLASLLSDGWIIPLGFLGLWLFRARWREAPALPAAVFALTLVYGAVHAVIRYRLPLMGGMILLACAAAERLIARYLLRSK